MQEISEIYWRKPKNVTRGYAKGRFGQIHYRVSSPQKSEIIPLVMLHQSPSSGRPFESILSHMGADRLVYAVDTPGFGDSDPPLSPPSIADYAGAIIDFLDFFNLSKVNLFGDHTGAKIALEVTRQSPTRICKLIFNSCPVYSNEQMEKMMLHLKDEKPKSRVPEDGSI